MPRIAKTRLSPRKMPLQLRSQVTVQAILEAATRVLARESLAGFNTNRVAEVAGVSVGSLYQYFPNKDALVTALIEQTQMQLVQSMQGLVLQLQGSHLQDKLQGLCEFAIEQQYGKPQLAAALDHEERRLPLKARLDQTQAQLGGLAMELLQPDLPRLQMQEIADVFTIAKALLEAQADGRKPPADLLARMLRAVKGYLGVA